MLSCSLYISAFAYRNSSVSVENSAAKVYGGAAYILSFDAAAGDSDITVSVCAENGDELGSAAVLAGAGNVTAYSAPIVMPETDSIKGMTAVDIIVSPSGADVRNIELLPVSEDIIYDVQKDGELTVKGSLDNNEPGSIELYILKDAEEYEYTDNSRVIYHTTLNVNRYGAYSQKINVDGITSYYSNLTAVLCGLKAIGYNTDTATADFRYTKTKLRDELIEKLKIADSAEKIEELIKGGDGEFPNIKLLGISDLDIVGEFESLGFLYSYLYENRTKIASDTILTLTEKACILRAFKSETPDAAKLAAYIDKYAELFEMTDGAYTPYTEGYAKEGAEVKAEIVSAMRTKTVKEENFKTVFAQQALHTIMNNCINYSGIEEILLKNADYLGIKSLDGISEKKKQTLCSYAKTTDDIGTIKDKLDELKKSPSSAAGGGGGSGSSGGGSASPSYPNYYKSDNASDANNNTLAKGKFVDVDSAFWAARYIEELAKKDIVAGYDDNTFRPNANISRAELTKLAAVAFGIKPGDIEKDFTDVSKDDWCYEYVYALASCGIVNGAEDGRFLKDEYITREDMAKILYGAAAYSGIKMTEGAAAFSDAEDISEYARTAVGSMADCGIISGTDGNMFKPHELATRAEAAKIIYMLAEIK